MRNTARRKDARLSREQVYAAYKIYCDKQLSAMELGRLLWKKFGYINPASCKRQLLIAFKSYSLPTRSKSVAVTLAKRGKCSGCGINLNERTRGCNTCRRRHQDRRTAGKSNISFDRFGGQVYNSPDRDFGGCLECGREDDGDYTIGCKTCSGRKGKREVRHESVV